jgi:hypothetical protein
MTAVAPILMDPPVVAICSYNPSVLLGGQLTDMPIGNIMLGLKNKDDVKTEDL